jgi:hypothetical protein
MAHPELQEALMMKGINTVNGGDTMPMVCFGTKVTTNTERRRALG